MHWIKQRLAADAAHWNKLWSMRLAIFWGCFNGAVLGLFLLGDYVNPLLLFALNVLGYTTIAIARVCKQPGLD